MDRCAAALAALSGPTEVGLASLKGSCAAGSRTAGSRTDPSGWGSTTREKASSCVSTKTRPWGSNPTRRATPWRDCRSRRIHSIGGPGWAPVCSCWSRPEVAPSSSRTRGRPAGRRGARQPTPVCLPRRTRSQQSRRIHCPCSRPRRSMSRPLSETSLPAAESQSRKRRRCRRARSEASAPSWGLRTRCGWSLRRDSLYPRRQRCQTSPSRWLGAGRRARRA
mmetsp:Transcript_155441/g.498716  ORF Transcript_155441/g.498716 Transcript_155441/m.498716 type:complete len:222 (-) Transcript_155441:1378-2043(-)